MTKYLLHFAIDAREFDIGPLFLDGLRDVISDVITGNPQAASFSFAISVLL